MRVLRFLVTSGLLIGFIGLIGWLGLREGVLLVATSQLKTSLNTLKGIEKNPQAYAQQCVELGANPDSELISALQLRFTSDREYQLEVICRQFQLEPLVIKREQLPMFVSKTAGSAGLIWGESLSGIAIQAFGRHQAIFVEQSRIVVEPYVESMQFGSTPVSSCAAFGFACCDEATTIGSGQQYSGVSDCPRTCFTSCQSRPIVLSFSADPYVDPATRTTTTSMGQPITFSFFLQAVGDLDVILDFGDGTRENFSTAEGQIDHTYSCSSVNCRYVAQLQATDGTGATLAESPISYIIVEVTR